MWASSLRNHNVQIRYQSGNISSTLGSGKPRCTLQQDRRYTYPVKRPQSITQLIKESLIAFLVANRDFSDVIPDGWRNLMLKMID